MQQNSRKNRKVGANNRIFFKLSNNSKRVLLIASKLAMEKMNAGQLSSQVKAIHLFTAVLMVPESLGAKVLIAMGVDLSTTIKRMGYNPEETIKLITSKDSLNKVFDGNSIFLSEEAVRIVSMAYQLANKYDHVYVGTEHILLSLLLQKELAFTRELANSGLKFEDFSKMLSNLASYPIGVLAKPESIEKNIDDNSVLSQIGNDLVQEARRGKLDPLIGRENELDQIVNILSRRKKNNPIIVGEAGVGKTAIIEGLAQRIANGTVPNSLRNCRIISIDIPNILAGSKLRGDVEEKMLDIVNEIKNKPDSILFIDEIQNILMSGSPMSGVDIASVLKPALLSGQFRCIGATTTEEYTRYFEEDNALARRFQPVRLEEASVDESIEILKNMKPILEKHHNIKISEEALVGAVKLSDRFVSDRYLPDKAIDLLDEATASRRLEVEVKYKTLGTYEARMRSLDERKEDYVRQGKLEQAADIKSRQDELAVKINEMKAQRDVVQQSNKYEVGVDTVRKIVSKWTGIPSETISQEESKSLMNLDKTLQGSVVGQKEAVQLVAGAIKRARAGISSPDRPWASFLFLGPTGVGKTELAKVLSRVLFGNEDRLIQIDMSEMMEMHSVSKLIGSPPGYVGYREGGQLTESVREHPHSVILFDEIEKAHPDVLNVLLQILEYGHLTDGKGKRVNFKNTVIILTSNIGAEEIKKSKIFGFTGEAGKDDERKDEEIEGAYDSMKEQLIKELKYTLRPELLNRLDDIVIFRSLTRKDAAKIVDLLLEQLNKRIKEQNVQVKLDASAVKAIVKDGFSEEYGARPLRRLLQDKVESLIAQWILENGGKSGKAEKIRTIEIVASKGKFKIDRVH